MVFVVVSAAAIVPVPSPYPTAAAAAAAGHRPISEFLLLSLWLPHRRVATTGKIRPTAECLRGPTRVFPAYR